MGGQGWKLGDQRGGDARDAESWRWETEREWTGNTEWIFHFMGRGAVVVKKGGLLIPKLGMDWETN